MSMDDDEGGNDGNKGGRFPDAVRKAVVSGISALFVTEESVRNIVSDLRLPKDAMNYVVQQTEKTRREMFRVVAHEVKGFLRNADVAGEMRRALNGLKVQVRAEVKFGEDKPDVALKTRVKRKKRRPHDASAPSVDGQTPQAAPEAHTADDGHDLHDGDAPTAVASVGEKKPAGPTV